MAEYTPTTNGVRNRYLWWYEAQQDRSPSNFTKYPDEVLAQFDRWLAAHDREVAAKALTDAADAWQQGEWADAPRHQDRVQERLANAQHVADWLRARAAALGVPEEAEHG